MAGELSLPECRDIRKEVLSHLSSRAELMYELCLPTAQDASQEELLQRKDGVSHLINCSSLRDCYEVFFISLYPSLILFLPHLTQNYKV